MADINPYLWIVVVGAFVSFLTGAGVGMNDLANAFGTTYGARILTFSQIVILASICEFAGSVSLGGEVTSTISGGIANPGDFKGKPYVFMYGMLCACGAAFCWLAVATWLRLPVSSTHSICGGVLGFALVFGGGDAVNWAARKDDFPFVSGVAPIIASWFISPLLTGAVSALVYGTVRFFVLRPANAAKRAMYTLPIIVAVAFFLESFFVLYKGASKRLHWSVDKAACVAACIGGCAGLISCAFIPLLKRLVARDEARALAAASEQPNGAENNIEDGLKREPTALEEAPKPKEVTGDVVTESESSDAEAPQENRITGASGLEVQVYDSRAERVFRYLQVFTAICASFAHGASDVSNAVGPLAAIYQVYQSSDVSKNTSVPIWVLCLGGAGIVVGLATFGMRLMRLLGEDLTVITPSRGFSAELSAALVVSFASGYGIPVSSTHCITGGVVGISVVDVSFLNIRWMMVLKMYAGWVFTLVITAIISATFFTQGINAPSL
ncbi:phosphate-Repressible Phosphate Permease-like protein [Leptomonas pyrrhocoris]|uniref:Phosphate transporter n=1 Tax=Leptomonas pyrrhocoris TaxID=157538 RepID=A0A0M9G9T2_LEPPY|nr:phosphate-Repressible Phosphate Permease-like protein [Leptomonas pyrrhocoris]XP_015664025.1 phosphate-Repressible Phosphate Permease-like protein [Leptomonas pyrrhocoris]KPA81924.1 phosphate-Repressible Phosphate Permease-like protein [Leptomonas pyrrhocoris]KPA85586.1 phosphate-Repressible Phosphate Permease-like protein [Leptomonas pyrrhocoris]|eukprot:XP_015660363.1 phosphate-Repressible Phosphate Permease-like protein [Leptomonas pyrrhocoris]